MQRIKITTLIDITCSNVKRPNEGTALEANQYRNWTTLLQAIGLRALISYTRNPVVEERQIKDYNFGSAYTGKKRVWTLEFTTERDDCWYDNDDPLYLLLEDLHNVPIIKNLNETINIDRTVFDLKSKEYRNTTVQII
jgi:hypothetical protein